mmetsp:Transcript_7481/g.13523  ORF Transcript_7481/g.13523 Transcript_7481/m.13523 type:complete len:423 (+) Transcript_7481:39-1307(+)
MGWKLEGGRGRIDIDINVNIIVEGYLFVSCFSGKSTGKSSFLRWGHERILCNKDRSRIGSHRSTRIRAQQQVDGQNQSGVAEFKSNGVATTRRVPAPPIYVYRPRTYRVPLATKRVISSRKQNNTVSSTTKQKGNASTQNQHNAVVDQMTEDWIKRLSNAHNLYSDSKITPFVIATPKRVSTQVKKQPKVIKKNGLKRKKKPNGFWNQLENVRAEFHAFYQSLIESESENSTQFTKYAFLIPTHAQMLRHGRGDLISVVKKYGGRVTLAELLEVGVAMTRANANVKAQKRSYKYRNLESIVDEVHKWGRTQGILDVRTLPTARELQRDGFTTLSRTIEQFGGFPSVAVRAGLAYNPRKRNYWNDIVNVRFELEEIIRHNVCEKKGKDGFPVMSELKRKGYGTLVNAIVKHGGKSAFLDLVQE